MSEKPKCIECSKFDVLLEHLQLCGACAFYGGHLRITDKGRELLKQASEVKG